jgi:hypothetical protein
MTEDVVFMTRRVNPTRTPVKTIGRAIISRPCIIPWPVALATSEAVSAASMSFDSAMLHFLLCMYDVRVITYGVEAGPVLVSLYVPVPRTD